MEAGPDLDRPDGGGDLFGVGHHPGGCGGDDRGQLVVGFVVVEAAAAGVGPHHRGDHRGHLVGQSDERGVAALAEERGDRIAVDDRHRG